MSYKGHFKDIYFPGVDRQPSGLCRNKKLDVRSPTTEQVKRPREHYI
jgi:hypothetical protein